MSHETRRRSAIHEAGHAIVGRSLGYSAIVDLSLHDSGGEAQFEHLDKGDARLPQLEVVLAMLLAGRAAEEIEFGDVASGFGLGSNLAQATALARSIDLQFELGKPREDKTQARSAVGYV